MKKTYIAPEMEEVKIGLVNMLCASDGSTQKPGLDDEYSEDDPS